MGRIVEVSSEGYSLRIDRGFLVLSLRDDTHPVTRIPLDEIESLVINTNATSLTSSVQISLAERGTPIVFCDARHLPIAVSLPISRNYDYSRRLREQAQLTQNKADQMWGQIVRSKIHRQSEVLQKIGKTGIHLQRIANKVMDGDPSNCEAEAAKAYWTDLFGDRFRRHSDDPINTRLNYGYAILRATVARCICAHGLSPSLGIHHRNARNPMCLVDDLMEPFRPLIDWKVTKIGCTAEAITKEQKMSLVRLMTQKVSSDRKSINVESLIKASVFSFYEVCSNPNAVLKIEWNLPNECE